MGHTIFHPDKLKNVSHHGVCDKVATVLTAERTELNNGFDTYQKYIRNKAAVPVVNVVKDDMELLNKILAGLGATFSQTAASNGRQRKRNGRRR